METVVQPLAIKLRNRSRAFALAVIRLVHRFPRSIAADAISRQLIRSATSVAANYRAAQRARSKAEFIAKIGIVVEEADETVFWLEMLSDSGIVDSTDLPGLLKEAHELLAIFAASKQTARGTR